MLYMALSSALFVFHIPSFCFIILLEEVVFDGLSA